MPNPSGFGQPDESMFKQARGLHQDARDFMASHLGSGPADDPGSRKYHSKIMEKLTRMGAALPGGPVSTGMLALLAGMENELVGGISEKAQGRPFVSEQGFDPVDLDANLRGVSQGIRRSISPFNR